LVRVAKAMGEDLDLEFDEQRTDATHIESNIEVKGRAALMAETIRFVDGWIASNQPEWQMGYSDELAEWLEGEDPTVFGRWSDEEYQAKLDELAEWAVELRQLMGADDEAAATEEFAILEQLIDEQCHIRQKPVSSDDEPDSEANSSADEPDCAESAPTSPGETDQEVEARDVPTSDCTSLQSPHDPDAGYRQDKGTGYNAHLTETCNNDEGTPEAITDIEVQPMEIDHGKLPGIVRRLHKAGLGPDLIYADGGYTSGMELLKIRTYGTEPLCPVPPGNRDPDRLGRHEFDIDCESGEVLECPAGESPFRHRLWRSKSRRKGKALHAFFYADQCGECPMEHRCPVEQGSSDGAAWRLEMRAPQVAHDRRVAEQETEAFQDKYAIRSGIEGTASEMKRAHGVEQLRVRRLPKVRMKTTLKAIGCNAKRWTKKTLPITEVPNHSGLLSFRTYQPIGSSHRPVRSLPGPIADKRVSTTI
jgi:hypothetical protein